MKWTHPGQPIVNTIQVDNLDAIIKLIAENGGEVVVPKQTVRSVGNFCYFKDPSGYIHGAMEPDFEDKS